MGGKILKEAAYYGRNKIVPKIKLLVEEDGCILNCICDGWEDGSKRHILRYIVQVLGEWMSYDDAIGNRNIIESDELHGIATAKLIKRVFTKIFGELNLRISCVVTDDADQYQRAERVLALCYPHMYFGMCYAHQVNLVVKDVLNLIHIKLVSRVKSLIKACNKSARKWLMRLTDRCKKLYGTSAKLLQIVDFR